MRTYTFYKTSVRVESLRVPALARPAHVPAVPKVKFRLSSVALRALASGPGESEGKGLSAMPCLPPRPAAPQRPAGVASMSDDRGSGTASNSSDTTSGRDEMSPQQPQQQQQQQQQQQPPNSAPVAKRRLRHMRLGTPLPASGPSGPQMQPQPQAVMQEKALAGLLAYIGMLGTVATGVSLAAPDVDLFGNFHIAPADIWLGLQLMVPVYVMNVAILLPNYSSWKIPETEESQQKIVHALQQWKEQQQQQQQQGKFQQQDMNVSEPSLASSDSTNDGSVTAGSSSTGIPVGVDTAAAEAGGHSSPEMHHHQQQPQQQQQQPPNIHIPEQTAPASTTISMSPPSNAGDAVAPRKQQQLLRDGFDQGLQSVWLTRLKDAMFLAQGHYLSANPALVLPVAVQGGMILIECLAVEMLYRSVLLQLAGGWLGDRLFEAGAEDWVNFATAGLPVLPTHMTGQLAAVAVLSAAWGFTVLRRVQRMSQRPAVMLGLQGKQAAGNLLRSLTREVDKQQQQQQQHQQRMEERQQQGTHQDRKADVFSASAAVQQSEQTSEVRADSSSSTTTATADADASVSSKPLSAGPQQQQQQQQESRSRAAADLAVAAASSQQQSGQKGPDVVHQPPQQQQHRMLTRLPSAVSALALSQVVQGVRDVSQVSALGLSFALTGNLAAPFAAAVVNQVLMSALQHHGVHRARQRNMAIAKHLASVARSLRDLQTRKDAERRQRHQQLLQDQQNTADILAGAPLDAQISPGSGTDGAAPAAAAAAATDEQSPFSGIAADDAIAAGSTLLHTLDDDAEAGGGGSAGMKGVGSKMEETINVLDQLLGPQGEHATVGK